jgi:hypothetical protein
MLRADSCRCPALWPKRHWSAHNTLASTLRQSDPGDYQMIHDTAIAARSRCKCCPCWSAAQVLVCGVQLGCRCAHQVDVLEYYPDDTVLVRSASASHLVPAVMRVRVYVQRDWKHAKVSLSRRNVMLRDRFCCQCAAFARPRPSFSTVSSVAVPRDSLTVRAASYRPPSRGCGIMRVSTDNSAVVADCAD